MKVLCPITYRTEGMSEPCRNEDLLGFVLKCNLYGELFIPLMAMKQIYWLHVGSAIDNR